VLDIMRLHSLREIPYGVYTNSTHTEARCPAKRRSLTEDPYRVDVTVEEARAFRRTLGPRDKHRAAFIAHFQWFDARSKQARAAACVLPSPVLSSVLSLISDLISRAQMTDEIPLVDLDEVDEVIRAYFPGGMLVW
jgi:hypothetical protein